MGAGGGRIVSSKGVKARSWFFGGEKAATCALRVRGQRIGSSDGDKTAKSWFLGVEMADKCARRVRMRRISCLKGDKTANFYFGGETTARGARRVQRRQISCSSGVEARSYFLFWMRLNKVLTRQQVGVRSTFLPSLGSYYIYGRFIGLRILLWVSDTLGATTN